MGRGWTHFERHRPKMVACGPHCALLLSVVLVTSNILQHVAEAAAGEGAMNRESCAAAVEDWAEMQLGQAEELKWQMEEKEAEGKNRDLPELLFFLHIARAGGRSYHQCFLSALMPTPIQCNMSYHVLREDPSHACRLLATHDDYSMTSRLPPGVGTGVTTMFREPVDRVLSMYEFSAHIAARSMGIDTSTYPDDTVVSARRKIREHYTHLVPTDTRNVWPWTLLSVAMEDDLWTRRDFVGIPPDPVGFDPETTDMYDRPHLLMPLRDFIQMPLAFEVVHNGAVFQLAGITNNTIWPEASRIRHCVIRFPELGQPILEVAKARVDTLMHLGFTDKLEEGMELLAAILGRSLSSPPWSLQKPGWKPKCRDMYRNTQSEPGKPARTLREAYQRCMEQQRELAELNERVAFNSFGNIKHSRAERKRIRKDVIAEIKRLNALDMEVTDYAREVYAQMMDKFKPFMESMDGPTQRDCIP